MKKPLSKEIVTDNDSSEDESISDSPAEELPKSSKKSADTTQSKPKNSSSKSKKARSSSLSSSSPESESEPENHSSPHKVTSPGPSQGHKILNQRTDPSIPAKPYTPPEGFQSRQKYPSKSSGISKSFSNLSGKQIWHITAPAGVPLTSIQELALDVVATGQSVLTHKGVDYRLREDQLGSEKTKILLVPDQDGKIYRRNPLPVVQTFHIEQIASVPNNATLTAAGAESAIQKLTKPLPSKPKHLRMRYKPIGSIDGGPETVGSSSEESEMEDVTFQVPKGSHLDRDVKKRKRTTDIDVSKSRLEPDETGSKGELPRKKVKKAHADSQTDVSKADRDRVRAPASDKEPDSCGSVEKEAEYKSSKKRKDETSQERRARKEDKKRKKREKEQTQ
ncbi:hypothetical protein VTO42DRAFT_948 [Malbranchea cinnamomea]